MFAQMVVVAVVVALAGHLPASGASSAPAQLTEHERHGKQLYMRGANAAGQEITAYLGDPPMEVPGSLMACANCHGYDGRGKPEGGVAPSDITWPAMTKVYGVTHESGRKHPPYDEDLLKRALMSGLDPAGNRLSPAMPRYRLSPEEVSDLAAYLRRVGNDPDPGLTEDAIVIGTLVPGQGRLAELGEDIRAVLAAFVSDINERGGIYSRKIELRVAHSGLSPADTAQRLRRFIEDEKVFAMVGAFTAGADQQVAALLEKQEMPLVGPAALQPRIGYPLNRQVFYLFPGVAEESRVLVRFARETFDKGAAKAAIVYPKEDESAATAEEVESECRKAGWDKVAKIAYLPERIEASALARQLRHDGIDLLFFLGSGQDEVALVAEAGRQGWRPNILSPVALAGRALLGAPPDFQGKLYLSFPMRSSDQSPSAVMEYRQFAAKHKLTGRNLAAEISAYAAATVLLEGLKKAGRDVSREKLIAALEGMYKFNTGLTPPLTYGPNRRIGALGAHIVEFQIANKDLAPGGRWIELQ